MKSFSNRGQVTGNLEIGLKWLENHKISLQKLPTLCYNIIRR